MSTYTVFHILMKEEGNPTRQMYEISQELNEWRDSWLYLAQNNLIMYWLVTAKGIRAPHSSMLLVFWKTRFLYLKVVIHKPNWFPYKHSN